MRRRKEAASVARVAPSNQYHAKSARPATQPSRKPRTNVLVQVLPPLLLLLASCWLQVGSGVMLATNCLASSADCQCSWKSGKFAADCSSQNLTKVPKNDHSDLLLENSNGENRMATLNRDIQALNLSSNRIGHISASEFAQKKFRNLQRLQIDHNKLAFIEPGAFFKLTGLVELDLSDNSLESLVGPAAGDGDREKAVQLEPFDAPRRENKSAVLASRSFLQDLSQLRQLNLNSNKLRQIQKFTFSPAPQLRQLYLSRNNLQFIDKRAFDGLNELNILHLDGNKLTYLNGELIQRLPKLHALQLAGAQNKWRCDCRLRKLVRLLLHNSDAKGAPKLSILQDEPRCHRDEDDDLGADQARPGHSDATSAGKSTRSDDSIVKPGPAPSGGQVARATRSAGGGVSPAAASQPSATIRPVSPAESRRSLREAPAQQKGGEEGGEAADEEDNHRDRHGRLWTGMKLADFECAPQLAADYLTSAAEADSSGATESARTYSNGEEAPAGARSDADKNNDNDAVDRGGISMRPPNGRKSSRARSVTLERLRQRPDEPIELTCPVRLMDELDIELTRVEWLHQVHTTTTTTNNNNNASSQQQPMRLMWRSNNNANQEPQAGPKRDGDEAQSDKQQRLIMMKLDSGSAGHRKADGGERHRHAPTKAIGGDKFAIIDYVTRANASDRDELESDKPRSGARPHQMDKTRTGKSLVRLVHLVADLASARSRQIWFVCRVSNSAGRLEVWQPVELTEAQTGETPPRQFEAARNIHQAAIEAQVEHLLASSRAGPARPSPARGSWAPLERVKALLEQELASLEGGSGGPANGSQPLFIPLSVTPRQLFAGSGLMPNSSSSSALSADTRWRPPEGAREEQNQMAGSLERSLVAKSGSEQAPQATRPTTARQAHSNATAGARQAGEFEAGHAVSSDLSQMRLGAAIDEMRAASGRNIGRGIIADGAGEEAAPTDTEATIGADDSDQMNESLSASSRRNNAGDEDQDSNLRDAALALIGRFTSERRALIMQRRQDQYGAEDSDEPLASPPSDAAEVSAHSKRRAGLGQLLADAWRRPDQSLTGRLGESYRILSGKLLETRKSIMSALLAPVPHLIVGLLVGCLLTSAILFKMNSCLQADRRGASEKRPGARRKATMRRKIADGSPGEECGSSGGKSSSPVNFDRRAKSNETNEDDYDYARGVARLTQDSGGDDDEFGSYAERAPSRQASGRGSCREETDEDDATAHPADRSQGLAHFVAANEMKLPPQPPLSGSSGSTATTTNGSQRMLLPPVAAQHNHPLEYGQIMSSNLTGGHFFSLPRQPVMHKSRTLQNFPGRENYECLMARVECSPSCHSTTNTSEAMSESTNQQSQLDSAAPDQIQRTRTMGRPARCANNWPQKAGLTNNKRTVTWLMSNDDVVGRDAQLRELSVANLHHLEQHATLAGLGATRAGLAESDYSSCHPQHIQTRTLNPYTDANWNRAEFVQAQRGANLAGAPSFWAQPESHKLNISHETGSGRTSSGIHILPACLCVGSSTDDSTKTALESDLILDLDETYHLHGMLPAGFKPQSGNDEISTRIESRGDSQLVSYARQRDRLVGPSSITSPNATTSTSSTSFGVGPAPTSFTEAGYKLTPQSQLSQLDDALILLQNSLGHCERL